MTLGPMPHNIVVYFFWQQGCNHCAAMRPIVQELRAKYMGRIMVLELNVEHHDKVEDVKIKATPTIVIKRDGMIVRVIEGVTTLAKLEGFLEARPQAEPTAPRRRRRVKAVDDPEGPDDHEEDHHEEAEP